ncbi:MAG: ROK family protein [Planctomycetota bacterium]|jgi:predicted NBD/HSP70 family sugar kinase|nr:ROK family protein [Planctomycetota bacterium]
MRASERRALLKTSNKPVNIKYHNQKLILSLFRQAETLSISELAKKARLSKTTIAKVIDVFGAKGLIVAAGKGESTNVGGKKPEIFAFNAAFSHVAALAIRRDRMLGAITDLRCRPLCQREIACDARVGYETALDEMADMLRDMLRETKIEPSGLCGVMLGCEGVFDPEGNRMRYTLQHPWGSGLDIGGDLAGRLPFPARIHVDNNVRLAGYAHLEAEQYGTLVVINSGRSTGGCVIEGRELIHGENGFVGEFGHMIIEPHSKLKCLCGGRGCFESLVSPDLVLAAARRRYADFPDSAIHEPARRRRLAIDDVFAAANAGDAFARLLMDEVVHYFTVLIHNITILRDPSQVVIQGVYGRAGEYFLSSLREKMGNIPFYKRGHNLSLSLFAPDAGDPLILGAARFGVDEFLRANRLYD